MFAVIASGGKQYKVQVGQRVKLETLPAEADASVDFDKVLLVANDADVKVGKPYVAGSVVSAKVIGHGRHKKVKIIKFKRRKHHMKHQGHRQNYTEVEITGIK